MITKELKQNLLNNCMSFVYIEVTSNDLGSKCSIFDNKVSTLVKELKSISSDITTAFNFTTEKYKILLPKLEGEILLKVVEKFESCSLSISEGHHFGNLF